MLDPKLIELARRVNWYEPPEAVAADTRTLLAHTMARGSAADIVQAQALFSEEQFRDAYRTAPPGLFSGPHWAYWGLMLLGDPEALPFPVLNPDAGWVWPDSFQDKTPPKPTTADDINWIATGRDDED